MTEYIEKSAAIHAVLHNEGQAAVAAVQEIKAVNRDGRYLIDVVYCEECKHSYTEGFLHPHLVCERHYEFGNVGLRWYCADGEREEQTDETD